MIVLIHLLLLISFVQGEQLEQPDAIVRRTEKVLSKTLKADEFAYDSIASSEFSSLYALKADHMFSGYLVFTSSKGRFDRFQYMIYYSPDIEVEKVKILQYNSSRGTGVTSRRWLRQFEGNTGEKLHYGKDVQAITGATFSATSITEDIPKVSQWVKTTIEQKHLTTENQE